MNLVAKTALGIDISDGLINLALLKKTEDGVKLLKTASGAVPDGAIENGNIANPTVLARAIKKLKAKNGIHNCPTAMSLVANPVLMQLLDIPKTMPSNIRQFVRDEVKHYAVLPIQNTAIDFCGLKLSGKAENRRVFVVATGGQKVNDAAKMLNREGLDIDAIEPNPIAYIRACYTKKIAKRFDGNIVFAIVQDDILTLCLFKNQSLDFVRTKQLEAERREPGKRFECLADEINAVIQFYELDVHNKCSKWEVTVLTNIRDGSVREEIEFLENRLKPAELEVRTLEDAYLDSAVANEERNDKPSAVAVGLAMKLLELPGCGLNVNLMPLKIAQARSVEKQVTATASVAAVIFFLMILIIGFFNARVNKVIADTGQKRPKQVSSTTRTLLSEQALLQSQITEVSGNLDRTDAASNSSSFLKWDRVFDEIGFTIPKMVRITKFSSKDNSQMLIEGEAASYKAVHNFVDALNSCKYIQSASLITSGKNSSSDVLLSYSISCSLVQ